MSKELLRAAVRANTARTGTRPINGTFYLGDGVGNVVADAPNRRAYYWQPVAGGNARIVSTAVLWTQSSIPFENISADLLIPITLGYPPNDSRLSILGQNGSTGVAATGGYTLAEMKANQVGYPAAANVQELRVRSLANITEVYIDPGTYIQPSTGNVLRWYGGDTGQAAQTLTTLIGALTSGQHQLVWICFDEENGSPVTVAATASPALGTVPSPAEFIDSDFVGITTAFKKLIPVYLYVDQNEITDTSDPATSNIYRAWDARLALAPRFGALFAQTATVTLASSTTETTLIGAGVGSVTLPASYLVAGKTIRVKASGYFSDTATPNLTIKVKFGATVITSTTATALAGTISNNMWRLECDITCRTTGASGTVFGQGQFNYDNSAHTGAVWGMVTAATVTVDTTATQAVSVTAEWGTNSASNTISASNLTIEAVN